MGGALALIEWLAHLTPRKRFNCQTIQNPCRVQRDRIPQIYCKRRWDKTKLGPDCCLQNMATPTTKKQVHAILGLVGYYRMFVPHFIALVKSLMDLTGGHQPTKIQWTDECDKAFHKVKEA